ncbi:hypothetical protein EXN31_01270 [Clostridium botulinum]|uniref:hypothetical protein n=1 Tax=Clostridium botulinum TaxID=1491 RepID=UPI0001F84EC9|nr:hypothetical protein [Clostridium botulinum]NFB15840.1 hypothetical protein [Clostridium botulinum]NFB66264.1 hypothetical protein [Clostridium botulinum]NFB97062.1 hypothetical protein [Clostridium botulinum]NFD07466.1 hypothetical protein [Clostridium botulinum]NFD21757.1 hypothetical protein [Clostridium botulinum]
MLIEKVELMIYENEIREEIFRLGKIHSSIEIAVMEVEQRDSIILTLEILTTSDWRIKFGRRKII